jgi:hypothetical protein
VIDITDTVHLAKKLASNINKKVVYLGDYPVLPSIVYAISTNSQLIAPAVASFKDAQSFRNPEQIFSSQVRKFSYYCTHKEFENSCDSQYFTKAFVVYSYASASILNAYLSKTMTLKERIARCFYTVTLFRGFYLQSRGAQHFISSPLYTDLLIACQTLAI